MVDDTPTPDLVTEGLNFFRLCVSATEKQIQREIDDLKFQVPEHQWPDEAKRFRAGYPDTQVGGDAQQVPPRPMLSISTLDEPIQLVLNQERRSHLGVNIDPLTEDATDDTARVLQDLYRQIEVDSRAHFARGWGYDRAVKAGRGVYRILTVDDPDSDVFGDQKIVIKRVLRQGSVYLDPFAQEPDWADGERAIQVEDIPIKRYKREFPDSTLTSANDGDLVALGNEQPGWIGGDTPETRTIRVAEYFYIEYDSEEKSARDWKGETRTVRVNTPRVKWCKFNASEVLDEQDWPGRYIPYVPVIGKELQPFDNERRWVGMIGPAKDGARLTNYAASAAVEMAALEPKAPWLMEEGQDAGHETEWQLSGVRNWPVLHYRRRGLSGEVAEKPSRVHVDMGRMGPSLELLHMGRDFVQAATSTFDPALGKQPTAHRSGRALVALQDQTVEGTSNYLANLAELSIPREALIVLDLIPHFYDRPGRIARVRDEQNQTRLVMLNAPHRIDPNTKRPIRVDVPPGMNPQQVSDDQRNPVKHYDLNKGRYGVSVTVGKSYKNRLQEGEDMIGKILEAAPELMPVIGDIWIKYTDVPAKQEIAERLVKMQPPQLRGGDDPQAAAQAAMALKAENQALKAELAKLTQEQEADALKVASQVHIAQSKDAAMLEKARMDNETRLAVAELGAKVDRIALFLEERARLGIQDHEAEEAAKQRAHDAGMAAQDHAHTSAQADQAHGQAMAQAEQGQDHAIEQTERSAELAPDPGLQEE